jgi:predicted dithiol-disulfide oxidoreductase (DUF899 family)
MKHKIVSGSEWIKSHTQFLKAEKQFTKQRDELAKQRRALPWTLVEKNYTFETVNGPKTLSELFEGKSQLFVQHFMFGPTWEEGCPGCSFQADHVNAALLHFSQKDVTYVAISRGPVEALEKYKKRMGWKFPWVSSGKNDFNFDFHVSFTEKDKENGKVFYNYEEVDYMGEELPGNSVFIKGNRGEIFHTYSSFARGCEMFLTTYMLLDLLPKGREEEGFKHHPMEWVRRHDQYETGSPKHCCD